MMLMDQISEYLRGHVAVINALSAEHVGTILAMVEVIVSALEEGGKLLIMGNGGSAADAQHFAAEMVGRFQMERKAIPALALTTDTSILTAVGNDYGFESIFSRQVEALARPGDVVFGISTSGRSGNVLRAMQVARVIGCRVLCLSGKDGGAMSEQADLTLVVPSQEVPFIQEAHLTIIHLLCKLIESRCSARGAL
jgi:D-sedoheptulose 7-phosphate isomerase